MQKLSFEEFKQELEKLHGQTITVIHENKNVHISPILIECFSFEAYPKRLTFIYDYQKERLRFSKENINEISFIEDETGTYFCIAFTDDSYIILGMEGEDND